jgi:hypothetical protein
MVVSPGVARGERLAAVGGRCRAYEPRSGGIQQVVDRPLEPLAGDLFGLAGLRPETGAPEQPFGLLLPEGTVVNRNVRGGH